MLEQERLLGEKADEALRQQQLRRKQVQEDCRRVVDTQLAEKQAARARELELSAAEAQRAKELAQKLEQEVLLTCRNTRTRR